MIKNIDKLDFIKMENFCDSNGTLKKCMSKEPRKWENVFLNYMSDNGLYLEYT